MLKLVIETQDRENYGAHAWDGKGDCPQYWKCKGGETIFCEVPLEVAAQGQEALVELVQHLCTFITESNDYYDSYVIGWSLEEADYECEMQKQYLEYGDDWNQPWIDLLGQRWRETIKAERRAA